MRNARRYQILAIEQDQVVLKHVTQHTALGALAEVQQEPDAEISEDEDSAASCETPRPMEQLVRLAKRDFFYSLRLPCAVTYASI